MEYGIGGKTQFINGKPLIFGTVIYIFLDYIIYLMLR